MSRFDMIVYATLGTFAGIGFACSTGAVALGGSGWNLVSVGMNLASAVYLFSQLRVLRANP